MKKILCIASILLLCLASCTKTPLEGPEPQNPDKAGLVAVTMELDVPVPLQAFTKANGRAEKPRIDYIKVAVFGTSGYPQAYTLAKPVNASGQAVQNYASENGTKYYFKVLLPVYEAEAHVHIIANGDEDMQFAEQTEDSIMKVMSTTNNVGAYWTRVVLKDGILPEKDNSGIMQTDGEGNFVPDENTKAAFENLQLVRNFAEVQLLFGEDPHIDVATATWTLMNIPTKGSVAPMAGGTYVDDFASYTYNSATGRMVNGDKVYNGYLFDDDPMDYHVPEGEGQTDVISTSVANPLFVYERTHPGSDKATCIMLKAKYSGDPDFTYYRIDLMDEAINGYFPLYRNYCYKVRVNLVGNRGASTSDEAALRDSGGNVSMTTEAQSLTDLSDGISRLYVEYMEKNFTKGGKQTVWLRYVPNVHAVAYDDNGEPIEVVDNTKISFVEVAGVDGKPRALKNGTEPTLDESRSTRTGWYFYDFYLKEQDEDVDLESVLKFKAYNDNSDNPSTLYRDVTVRVMKKMDMDLTLDPKHLTAGTDKNTRLDITLPVGLPESMFPLELLIEDVNHTLNPTGQDGHGNTITVPVKVATSLMDGKSSSFYFIRTVDYQTEYKNSNVISTQFKTIESASATTLYVANEYFKTHSTNLLNDGIYVNPTAETVDFNVTSVKITVDAENANAAWSVTPGTGVAVNPSSGRGPGSFTMSFDENNSTTESVTRTATVSGVKVAITQTPLVFSVAPEMQETAFNSTSATVTVYAAQNQNWTATVDHGATFASTGTATLTGRGTVRNVAVNFTRNEEPAQRTFRVTATMSGGGGTASATIVQRRGPNTSETFTVNDFSFNAGKRSGSALSDDEYVRISLANIGNTQAPVDDGFVQMGYFADNAANRGSIVVTPEEGLRITSIIVTYSDESCRSYDTDYNPVLSVSGGGTYAKDEDSPSITVSWNTTPTGAVTLSNGYRLVQGNFDMPRITSIQVVYAAD